LEDEVEVDSLIRGVFTVDACWVVVTMVEGNMGKKEKDHM